MLIEVIALIPFILLFVLIIIFRIPAIKSVPVSLFFLVLISIFIWKMPLDIFGVSIIRGVLLATEIILIIFGAIFLISILRNTNYLSTINEFLSSINPDARIQVIILAWLFGSLIEGVAGFGTPAAIVAPLLYSIGFSPILAVVAPLISNSLAVSFGAAGVPILIGLGSYGFSSSVLAETTFLTALIHSIAGIIIPLFLIYFTIQESKVNNRKRAFLEAVPFALFVWAVFVFFYLLVAYFIGPELPSIIASLASLLICGYAAKKNFLQPKSLISFSKVKKRKSNKRKILLVLSPYFLIISFLLISRAILPVKVFLTSINIGFFNILGTGTSYSFSPIYSPAFIFILTALLFAFLVNKKGKIIPSIKDSLFKIEKPFIALIFTLIFVQILILSSNNNSLLPSIPTLLANSFISIFGKMYIFFSPFVGAIGSFISGSNTVSNLLFASLQSEAAISIGVSVALILALQSVGGGIGNMIAIHNVLAAQATVHLHNKEGIIIRKIILVTLIYAILAGLIGLAIFYII